MTLSADLLPAMQHYALFAAAFALFSLSLTHVKRRFGIWVWLMVMVVVLPVFQMAWSLWETIREVVAVEGIVGQSPRGSHAAWWIVAQALVHGVTILLVLLVVLCIASRTSSELPRRVKLEPTVGGPASRN